MLSASDSDVATLSFEFWESILHFTLSLIDMSAQRMGLVTVLCWISIVVFAMEGQEADLPFLPQLVNLVSDDSDVDDNFLASQHDQTMANLSFDPDKEYMAIVLVLSHTKLVWFVYVCLCCVEGLGLGLGLHLHLRLFVLC